MGVALWAWPRFFTNSLKPIRSTQKWLVGEEWGFTRCIILNKSLADYISRFPWGVTFMFTMVALRLCLFLVLWAWPRVLAINSVETVKMKRRRCWLQVYTSLVCRDSTQPLTCRSLSGLEGEKVSHGRLWRLIMFLFCGIDGGFSWINTLR
jgi:hypothetical protein